jgi:hypothetical protein
MKRLFLQCDAAPAFVDAIARTVTYDWSGLRALLEDVLKTVAAPQRPAAIRALFEGVNAAAHRPGHVTLPTGLGVWLLDQLVALPDLGDLGGTSEWYLDDTLKIVGRAPLSWLPGALAARAELERKREDGSAFYAIGYHFRLSTYVQSIAPENVADAANVGALRALLDLVADNGTVGYHLPEILRDVDPQGLMVPAMVVARLGLATNDEDARRWSRVGGAYAVGSAPWRAIAVATVKYARRTTVEAKRSLFATLAERGIRSFSGKPGEVPPVFVAAVAGARSALEAETDPELRPFWEWRLAGAEAELREEEERAKEERGE